LLHEQNAVLGRANRLLAPRASKIAIAFPQLQGLGKADPGKLVVTGNPVRPAIAAIAGLPFPAADGPLQLLVTGGSQGARVFSRVVPAAVGLLPASLRGRLRVSQQCRAEDLGEVRQLYAQLGVEADLASFFDDIPERLAAAHLVIARAGASTCAELAAAGRPALLVPYPFAADDHQAVNAGALAETGGAWVMPQRELEPASLAERLRLLLADPRRLNQAAIEIRRFGHRDAAERLADVALGLIGGSHRGDGGQAATLHQHRRAAE
jgi:UDP-N-acetylglucosamine--N-acetylmuramyl-(pentapeptide) pyrophosphoryl-undecaprenol N-acetylglucosamine transferase